MSPEARIAQLEEEVRRLKVKEAFLSHRVWYYKYKARLAAMSNANTSGKSHVHDTVAVGASKLTPHNIDTPKQDSVQEPVRVQVQMQDAALIEESGTPIPTHDQSDDSPQPDNDKPEKNLPQEQVQVQHSVPTVGLEPTVMTQKNSVQHQIQVEDSTVEPKNAVQQEVQRQNSVLTLDSATLIADNDQNCISESKKESTEASVVKAMMEKLSLTPNSALQETETEIKRIIIMGKSYDINGLDEPIEDFKIRHHLDGCRFVAQDGTIAKNLTKVADLLGTSTTIVETETRPEIEQEQSVLSEQTEPEIKHIIIMGKSYDINDPDESIEDFKVRHDLDQYHFATLDGTIPQNLSKVSDLLEFSGTINLKKMSLEIKFSNNVTRVFGLDEPADFVTLNIPCPVPPNLQPRSNNSIEFFGVKFPFEKKSDLKNFRSDLLDYYVNHPEWYTLRWFEGSHKEHARYVDSTTYLEYTLVTLNLAYLNKDTKAEQKTVCYHPQFPEVLEEETTGMLFCDRNTRMIKKKSPKAVYNCFATKYKLVISPYDQTESDFEIGLVPGVDDDTKIEDIVLQADPLAWNSFTEKLIIEMDEGDDFYGHAKGRELFERFEVFDDQICVIYAYICKVAKLYRISDRNASALKFAYPQDADKRSLVDCIFKNSSLSPQNFELKALTAKKSGVKKGFLNLNRYPAYETLDILLSQNKFDSIYYDFGKKREFVEEQAFQRIGTSASADTDLETLPNRLSEDVGDCSWYHRSYVVKYDKHGSAVEGEVRRYQSETF